MADATERMGSGDSIEELVFLARSRHRVALLGALSREERTRRELQESTDISQPTLSRILGDFEQRRWVSNEHNGAYTLTPLGSLLASAVEDLLAVLESSTRLAALADALPLDRLGFDLRHLATASVTTPSEGDTLAHMRRFDELVKNAKTVQVFSNVLTCAPGHGTAEVHMEFLADVDELVVTATAVRSGVDDPALRRWLENRIDAGELVLYRYDDSAAFLLGCFDETVGIVPVNEDGMPAGLIDTSAAPVYEWSQQTFGELKRGATRLASDDLSA